MTDKLDPNRNILVPTTNNSLATRSSSLVKRGLEALGSKQPHVGTLTYPNGDRYVGEFRDDKCNGQGTFTFSNGDKYVGEFRDDKINGHGTHTCSNGDKYIGEGKDGKYNGQGTYTFSNGDKYVGEFKDNTYNGFGILYRADGSVLQSGIWKDGGFIIRN